MASIRRRRLITGYCTAGMGRVHGGTENLQRARLECSLERGGLSGYIGINHDLVPVVLSVSKSQQNRGVAKVRLPRFRQLAITRQVLPAQFASDNLHRMRAEALKEGNDTGFRLAVTDAVLEPRNPFEPANKRRPKSVVAITLILVLVLALIFLYFSFHHAS
jgi:hypothetical protein